MLPSGNDAAHTLAEYFGELLQNEAKETEEKMRKEAEENMRLENGNKDGRHSGQDSIQSNLPTNHTSNDTDTNNNGKAETREVNTPIT